MIETERLLLREYPSLYSCCKYTNEASYRTAEAIGMHFDREYRDAGNYHMSDGFFRSRAAR